MTIFIDASIFCAYANTNDVHHKKAKEILKRYIIERQEQAITSEYIFDETVTVALRKANKNLANEIGQHLLNSEYKIAKVDQICFEEAWKLFQEEKNNFSFTDCTCIILMRKLGIKQIATFDKEFKKIKEIQVIDI
ncbi:type II toxin-antitoxin system VapC family toxin [Candidatus Woesearchaeota archaeon]|nr:type II toxin-antitoxin system VapC family toxin [Candidatus Woesearchaeota archaeon]